MGAEQQNGAYKIEPNKDYGFDLEFAENESTQLANEKTLVYKVPKEMKVTQDGTFTISESDGKGTLKLSGNEFNVVSAVDHQEIHVKLNKKDSDFNRFKEVKNARFHLNLRGQFREQSGNNASFSVLGKTFQYKEKKTVDKKAESVTGDKEGQTGEKKEEPKADKKSEAKAEKREESAIDKKEEPVMERSVAPVSNLLRSGLVRSGGTRATETTDLNQMTQSIEMVGIEQTNGVYLI